MGERSQIYVNYGKPDFPGGPGENLFAMHLQWCWGQFSVIRAHQLVNFLDGAKDNAFNPFGLGEESRLGGMSFDGRREDLYLLKALTEINTVSSSIVAGHDLVAEEHGHDKWRLERDEISRIPSTIKMDPLAQDNNHGFLVVQATEDGVKYAFCKDVSAIEPISASEYLKDYQDEWSSFEPTDRATIVGMVQNLETYPLLTKEEMAQIFDREYEKKLNIEGYQEPKREMRRHEPLSDLLMEAKSRLREIQAEQSEAKPPGKQHFPER